MTRKIISFLLILTLACTMPVFVSADTDAAILELWVSVDGSDSGNGSASSPFQSIERAQEEVRKYNQNMTGDIIVHVGEGAYFLQDELRFRPEDSGSNGYDVIWRGVRSNPPTISGGRPVNAKWTKGENGIWSAYVPEAKFIRDLFVNERVAVRARSHQIVFGEDNYLPAGSYFEHSEGFYAKKSVIGLYKNPEDIMLRWSKLWKDYQMHVSDIIQDPMNEDRVIVVMNSKVWDAGCGDMAGGDEAPHYSLGFFVENAFELLDEPGEFYFDKKTKMLSYLPREDEDMNNASVIYGYLDTMLRVEGRDHKHHTQNIRFEDLRFAHATYSIMEETDLLNQQGEVPYYPLIKGFTSLSNTIVQYATNIDFEACVFFGMNSIGLCFAEGVFDSSVEGCVFTDIGGTAFVLGRYYIQTDTAPAPSEQGPANVVFRKGWTSSYGSCNMYQSALGMINPSSSNEYASAKTNDTWRGEPWAADKGTLPWVKIDLDDAYSLESVEISFEATDVSVDVWGTTDSQITSGVSDEEKSNFEVLVSNDRDFKDYKVIATFDSPAPEIATTKGTDGEKYRYLMLRKTVPGPFAITGVKAYSYDRLPLPNGAEAGVKNITFDNNYIERAGMIHTQSLGILTHFPTECSVSNNEIRKVGYQGMCSGWGFASVDYPNTLNRDNKINHNLFEDVMMQTHDGGGIYTLGWQPGTEYIGNVISDSHHMYAGFYMDFSSSRYTVRDTVILNCPEVIEYYNTAEGLNAERSAEFESNKKHAIKMTNTYSDVPDNINNPRPGIGYLELEKIKNYTNKDKPDDLARILGEAGITEEWQWICDRAPDHEYWAMWGPDVMESSSNYKVHYETTANTFDDKKVVAQALLDNGSFGDLPWQYDGEMYYELVRQFDNVRSGDARVGTNGTHLVDDWNLGMLIRDIYDSEKHLELDEMLELCDTAIESAVVGKNIGNCTKKALDTFKKSVDEAKKLPRSTMGEKAIAVNRLEKAYEKFCNESYNADIIACWLPQGESVIDKDNRTVTLIVPQNVNLRDNLPQFMVSENAVLSEDVAKLNYNKKENTISVYNKDARKYCKWKLVIKREAEDKIQDVSVASSDWTTTNPNTDIPSYEGKLTLQPYWESSMMNKAVGSNLSFKTMVPDGDKDNGIHYIFCAQTSNLEHNGALDKNTYYELVLKGYTAYLNRVDAGVVTEMAKLDGVNFTYGSFNDINISIEGREENDIIKIDLNGETIFNHLTLNPIKPEGFFGVYSRFQKVVISK